MATYQQNQDGGIILGVGGVIPEDLGNRDYAQVLDEVASGDSTIIPYVQSLGDLRSEKIRGIRSEAIRRIGIEVNVIPELEMTDYAIGCYQHAWPVANASAQLLAGKSIYDYAKTKLNQVRIATQPQLDAYDPATDVNWP